MLSMGSAVRPGLAEPSHKRPDGTVLPPGSISKVKLTSPIQNEHAFGRIVFNRVPREAFVVGYISKDRFTI